MLRDDRILRITSVPLALLAALSSLFGPLLFFFPNNTETLFVWTIQPAMSAVFVGAGYMFGALMIWHLLRLGKWHPLRVALTGTLAFAVAMLGATLLHWDRFHQGTILFYGWFAVYLLTPILIPLAYWRNRIHDPGPQPGELLLSQRVRLGMAIVGVGLTVVGLVLFVVPTLLIPVWPWRLTPLVARVMGGWVLLLGVGSVVGYIEPRWSSFRPLLLDAGLWGILLIVGSLLQLGDFTNGATWLWFLVLSAGTLTCLGIYLYYEKFAAGKPFTSPTQTERLG